MVEQSDRALNPQPEAVDHDPLDSPLPCDFKTPRMTFRKGVTLRTVLLRMMRLEEAAFGPLPTPEQQARNLEVLRGNLPLTEWQGDSPIGLAGRSIGWCAVCVALRSNYVHHSRIVRTKHDAESIVKQWADSWGKYFNLYVIQLHQRPTESAAIPGPEQAASGSHRSAGSDEQNQGGAQGKGET